MFLSMLDKFDLNEKNIRILISYFLYIIVVIIIYVFKRIMVYYI